MQFLARRALSGLQRRANGLRFRAIHHVRHHGDIIYRTTEPKPWHFGKLNHVAIAVPDLRQAKLFYRDVMGATVSDTLHLEDHGVSTVFVDVGETKIELIHPLGSNSPITKFLDNHPQGGIHHMCYEVADIHEAVADLRGNNIRILDPEPKIGAHGKPVVFLHPKDCGGVLIELQEGH